MTSVIDGNGAVLVSVNEGRSRRAINWLGELNVTGGHAGDSASPTFQMGGYWAHAIFTVSGQLGKSGETTSLHSFPTKGPPTPPIDGADSRFAI